ncbi:MAG: hypothetical protein AB7U63_11460 [Porticoccaceae bacterium]|jgi:hypothetical protein
MPAYKFLLPGQAPLIGAIGLPQLLASGSFDRIAAFANSGAEYATATLSHSLHKEFTRQP